MLVFLEFLHSYPRLRLNFLLACLFLCLLPARNPYYSLQLTPQPPLVRAAHHTFLPPTDYPVNPSQTPAPLISAQSALVVDVHTKAILYQKNPDIKLPPASTTKIITGLVALETYPLDQIVTIDYLNGEGQTMELEMGERITVENLLYGLLVQSGNDAATTLARLHPQGEAGFVTAMNQKVKDLNLTDTQFTNPAGLDDFGHYTTVHDLSLMAAAAMADPTFKKMVSTTGITVSDVDQTIFHELETINELLGEVPGLSGVKTGWTELAGECLVTYTQRQGQAVITVVLNSQDRFADSQALIDWAFTNHQWQSLPPTTRL